jgi:deoxyribonuclease V
LNSERLFEFKDAGSARARQREFSLRVVDRTPSGFSPRRVCGLDAAYRGGFGVGVAAVWDLEASCMAETRSVVLRVPVDYAPGLLGFREGPLVVAAAKMLRGSADVFLADGHGVAHPDRFGLACHVGLALDKPTVGVAKSILHGHLRDG